MLEGLAEAAGVRANGIEPVAVPLALCTAELAGIVGKVYALVCKASGPALADKTLARALESAEREQPGFDPRRLL